MNTYTFTKYIQCKDQYLLNNFFTHHLYECGYTTMSYRLRTYGDNDECLKLMWILPDGELSVHICETIDTRVTFTNENELQNRYIKENTDEPIC